MRHFLIALSVLALSACDDVTIDHPDATLDARDEQPVVAADAGHDADEAGHADASLDLLDGGTR